jgi:hypothetical protein
MMPYLVTVRRRRPDGRGLRLYVPVLPLRWALPGARIEVEQGRTAVLVSVR